VSGYGRAREGVLRGQSCAVGGRGPVRETFRQCDSKKPVAFDSTRDCHSAAAGHLSSLVNYALLVLATTATIAASLVYRNLALQRGIIAKISSRTLHERTVPRGGGLVLGLVFALGVFVTWLRGDLPTWVMLALGVGGAAAVVLGFIDDIYEVPALKKLATQTCLAVWL